jgi:hypothetical protein
MSPGERNVEAISVRTAGAMNDLRKMYQATAIVCGALFASLFIYVAAVEVTRTTFEEFAGFLRLPNSELLRYLVYSVALMQLGVIKMIKARSTEINASDVPSVIISKLSKTAFLGAGLSEIPAALGLVLFLLLGLYADFYILWLMSLVLMLIQFPRLTRWEQLARRARGMH